jgi:hypothetical protein
MGVGKWRISLMATMNQATPTASRDLHSTAYIGSIQTHGTQLLLVSSNRFDSSHRSPGKHNAARFQPAAQYAENESSVFVSFASQG